MPIDTIGGPQKWIDSEYIDRTMDLELKESLKATCNLGFNDPLILGKGLIM